MASNNETYDIRKFLQEHPFLFELIGNDGIIYECSGEAPSPSKDYGQIQINLNQIILRWWKITLRNIEGSIYPGEIKDSYEDFYHDEVAHREIWRIFGQRTLDHCLNIVCGQIDWLSRLPLHIQIKIFSYVNLDDIPQLSSVSKLFRTICRHNDLWKIFYIRQHGRYILKNKDLVNLAEKRGWRHVFFTNRLKLQMELRREAQVERYHPEDPSDSIQSQQRQTQIQQSSVRRHSYTARKGSPILNREKSDINAIETSSSPLSARLNTGSMTSTSSKRR